MSKKIAGTSLDPSMPHATVTIGGETYHLIFTFRALVVAQEKLKAAGVKANLFDALSLKDFDPSIAAILFYASLITFQPDITYDEAIDLVPSHMIVSIWDNVIEAYRLSMTSPGEAANPQLPAQA